MRALNLGLRFVLELCGIAALAAWGWQAGGGWPVGLVVAAAAVAALVVTWALLVAPKAANPVPQAARMVIGTVLLLACAALLASAGQVVAGALLAVVSLANTAALLWLGGPGGARDAGRVADPSRRG